MIDMTARQQLKACLESYLDESITAFELDDRLQAIECSEEDGSLKEVISILWFCYDDCKDHKIVACKEEWDFFQRVLLFLDSGLSIADLYEDQNKTGWHLTQAVAFAVLSLQIWMFLQGDHWFMVTALGALASIPIWIVRDRCTRGLFSAQEHKDSDRWLQKYYPFSSISQMKRAAKEMNVSKVAYPKHLEDRVIRDASELKLMTLWSRGVLYCSHLVLSPLILLFECFPMKEALLAVRARAEGGDQ
ncbi:MULTISPECIES: hypothetical protein [unclassified Lentimonas]|uniref:hypothetical protein n=1 Tax=unclassified Lentimonas TaxID=2630993 RepID=UPI001320D793|nr:MULTISPECIES: hypothetical protein [unclassified Lentimonas]CAA6679442.1 Unannotated [Lentimonas sp. CC4]CAA6687113.1 Unannotated [Lentimonas sp. CC6]CAA7075540.1 Unannotated [Lentimonas sp. CC4]CAA7170307.1 Unannotated [Lentimonas sp. CC21]CAA7182601.1 Unannotated [Lentimonas sp. CC8]